MQLTEKERKLVEDNQKLVYFLVKKFYVEPKDREDVEQLGMLGLCKAAATFKESKNSQFSTYAAMCIQNEIRMYYRKYNRILEREVSLDAPIFNNDEENEDSGVNKLSTMLFEDEDFTEDMVAEEEFAWKINLILNVLEDKNRIIALLQLSDLTQKEIGIILGYSRSYISRIEGVNITKLNLKENDRICYKKIYCFEIINNYYVFKFEKKRVSDFNKIFAILLEKLAINDSLLFDFRLECDEEQIVIFLPKDSKAFGFIAQIILVIEDYLMQ